MFQVSGQITITSGWFQPIGKLLVIMNHFFQVFGVKTKKMKPPPRQLKFLNLSDLEIWVEFGGLVAISPEVCKLCVNVCL